MTDEKRGEPEQFGKPLFICPQSNGEAPEQPREVKGVFLYPDNCNGIQSRTEAYRGKGAAPTE